MVELNTVLLFRVSSAFSIMGLSLISFLIGGLTNENSSRMFGFMHSFCAGIVLGLALLFYNPDGIVSLSEGGAHATILVSSLSYVLMIAIEYFTSSSIHDYSVVTNDQADNADDGMGFELVNSKRVNNGNNGLSSAPDRDEAASDSSSLALSITQLSIKMHPIVLLFSACSADMLGGLYFSTKVHYTTAMLAIVAFHRFLMSCAMGTMLESTSAPRSIFVYFMFTYSLSSPMGIIAGTILFENNLLTDKMLVVLKYFSIMVNSLAAGVYLYIATRKMIPDGVLSDSTDTSVSNNDNSGRNSIRHTVVKDAFSVLQSDKTIKFASFVLGLLVTTLPTVLLYLL